MKVPDVLTLTPNPALDIATGVRRLQSAHKMRCDVATRHPGGGGVNVARVLQRFGVSVRALLLAGGPSGLELVELLQGEGVDTHAVPIVGATRESLAVTEHETGREFRFVMPGPEVTASEWTAWSDAARLEARRVAERGAWVVASGSVPPQMEEPWAVLLRALKAEGVQLALDASGPALVAAMDRAGVIDIVKPSLRELSDLTGRRLDGETDWHRAALDLVQRGMAGAVALSLGPQGALLVTPHAAWHAEALDVAVVSTSGAGDSFLAALLWAWLQGQPPPDSLRHAVAAGAAALAHPGTALCTHEDVIRLAPQVKLRRL